MGATVGTAVTAVHLALPAPALPEVPAVPALQVVPVAQVVPQVMGCLLTEQVRFHCLVLSQTLTKL